MARLFRDHLHRRLQDPAFARVFEELTPEYQVAHEVIRLRLARGLTQAELAERMGVNQSSISRLERASVNPSLDYLRRVAEALSARLEIRLTPLEAAMSDRQTT